MAVSSPHDQPTLQEILDKYSQEEGALIPVLQEVQATYGYLSKEAMRAIGKALHLSPAQVYSVATFYAQFHTRPSGKHIIRVCRGTACHVRGSDQILAVLEKRLGLQAGGTTPDLQFTLETVACIGACGLAPTMVISEETYGHMTIDKVQRLLKDLGVQAEE